MNNIDNTSYYDTPENGDQNIPDQDLYTLPFSILTAEAHNILYQWLEKQSDGHFERDRFSINKIYKKYYGCIVFWFSIKQHADIARSPLEPGKKHEIVIIPGNSAVPTEAITLAQNYDFMQLTEINPSGLTHDEFMPICVSEEDVKDKAIEKLKKQQPSFFDENGELKNGIDLNMSFPAALPFWEGTYHQRPGRDHKFLIEAQTGEIDGDSYISSSHAAIPALPFPPKYLIIAGVTLVMILMLFLLSLFASNKQKKPDLPTPISTNVKEPQKVKQETKQEPAKSQSQAPQKPAENNAEAAINNLVQNNFNYINDKKYQAMYELRTANIRATNTPLTYEERYTNNIGIRVEKIDIEQIETDTAQVVVDYASTDRQNGEDINSTGIIRFYLSKEDGKWLISDSEQIK